MQMSLPQRKLALLYDRLQEMAHTRECSPTGRQVRHDGGQGSVFAIDLPLENPIRLSAEYLITHRTDVDTRGKTLKVVDAFVTRLFRFEIETPVSDEGLHLYVFAAAIGMSRERARYIIDYMHAGHLPTYSAVTQPREETRRFVLEHAGLYVLYRHDDNRATRESGKFERGIVTRSALSIRYPVPYRPHATDKTGGDSRIRCRLIIPAYSEDSGGRPYKYDGYVGIKDSRWMQFLFQARPSKNGDRKSEDLILMYTEHLPKRNGEPAHSLGVQLTQNQEYAPAVSSVVLLRHPGCPVTENEIDPAADFLQPPFSMPADAETSFTRETVATLDLAKTDSWSANDLRALALLMHGWSSLNQRGLH